MKEPLLLISEKLQSLQKSLGDSDLIKGKGNRDGLIQQIVTYVRDGHTITRKQWVRSEFADHAKKNEEEKKKTLLNEEAREENKRRNDLKDENDKKLTEDNRAKKKIEKRKEEMEAHGSTARNKKVNGSKLDAYKKKLEKQRKKEEEERKKQDKKDKDEKSSKKKHTAYGHQDQTKADNKLQDDLATNYSRNPGK